ncbi:CPBP family intramembrane metalloprotease [Mangrovimonas sp. AS39]|uniref:CPBP family intramembrane glutamic endopeptidase n=1 Tax=Mangrovimonas futianensis TaxID=2895523 RepID=UPI001E4CAB18|nr:CPBP family intramembrane glutamic endopeptidase [Mangrovimonas futianensis]MCF1192763.1 CPBP family intramembrane metalloprotease [Mangrovimonas futianensis]MCF1196316.1 CPBP family intramembrane metalloprotease [Mangrovimonas futianensis]
MKEKTFRLIEFFILFVIFPVSFAMDYPVAIKVSLGVLGFLYVLWVMIKLEGVTFFIQKEIHWGVFIKRTLVKFFVLAVFTILFVLLTDKERLFTFMIEKPLYWFLFTLVYILFSVYPQELLYRTFFFKRYSDFFKSEALLIFMNAILFSLAHLFFRNTMVHVLTFIGGVIFALTYQRTKSTLLVSIEHALYGSWLFMVGMGGMLGFPT